MLSCASQFEAQLKGETDEVSTPNGSRCRCFDIHELPGPGPDKPYAGAHADAAKAWTDRNIGD
ncbi:hypothetical protein [Mesorhizobium silamurunense]|uniref:hypothetical protein n=1 Tax=Mesorhizobium silamurunense TaxID=499528 RepID=UPI001FECEF19|nr:hypothetical protein [Mesorhizobium silamurunense]